MAWAGPLFFLLLLVGGFWFGRGLERAVDAEGFRLVETDRSALELERDEDDVPLRWFDPVWEELLARRVAAVGPFLADDPEGPERVRASVAALAFVAECGTPSVIWPDGLSLPLRLREPLACVAFGDAYYALALDPGGRGPDAAPPRGILLPGAHSVPPRRGAGFLPVVERLDEAPPDVWLDSRAVVDALAVAQSMWAHAAPRDLERLGRVVIDARRARETSVEEPGTRIALEGRRVVLFGRSPAQDEPGELPAAAKWRAVGEALDLLDAGRDWAAVDVRWDRPDVLLRGAAEGDGR